tara:strand:+ start:3431 stop:4210 length:780 start_codon:yes stop_codon:yes gene_type:complete
MAGTSPTTSLIIFLILTLGYFIAKYYISSSTSTVTILYVLAVFVSQFFINVSITESICGSPQYVTSIYTTVLPWLFIFGSVMGILKLFPSWLAPFSNTFGYGVCILSGINGLFEEILTDRKAVNIQNKDQAGFVQAVDHLYEDKSVFINSLTLENLSDQWKSMRSVNLIKSSAGDVGGAAYNKLVHYIKMKNEVSEFIWYLLAGSLVTSLSYNSIVNAGCQLSAEEMKKRHDEYLAKEKEIAKKKDENAKTEMVYKTYD